MELTPEDAAEVQRLVRTVEFMKEQMLHERGEKFMYRRMAFEFIARASSAIAQETLEAALAAPLGEAEALPEFAEGRSEAISELQLEMLRVGPL